MLLTGYSEIMTFTRVQGARLVLQTLIFSRQGARRDWHYS
jgi:hypothetical protein